LTNLAPVFTASRRRIRLLPIDFDYYAGARMDPEFCIMKRPDCQRGLLERSEKAILLVRQRTAMRGSRTALD
jgi:hypothetical protein